MAGFRINRVSEDIKREVIAVIRELKDPRVMGKMLTVVRVEVSSDASWKTFRHSASYLRHLSSATFAHTRRHLMAMSITTRIKAVLNVMRSYICVMASTALLRSNSEEND